MGKLLIIGIIVSMMILMLISSANATWCDTNYGKKVVLKINNSGASVALTDYQVEYNITDSEQVSDMQADFDDMRIYNETSETLIVSSG